MSANAELELGQSVAERWRDLDERKRSPMASLGKKIVDQKEQMEIWGFLHYDRRDPGATWTRFTPGRRLSGSLCFGEPSHVIHEQLEILRKSCHHAPYGKGKELSCFWGLEPADFVGK
jgi:hypothetical protein